MLRGKKILSSACGPYCLTSLNSLAVTGDSWDIESAQAEPQYLPERPSILLHHLRVETTAPAVVSNTGTTLMSSAIAECMTFNSAFSRALFRIRGRPQCSPSMHSRYVSCARLGSASRSGKQNWLVTRTPMSVSKWLPVLWSPATASTRL